MVADFDVGDTLANALYDTTALMSENDGESSLGILARKRVGVLSSEQRSFSTAH